MAGGLLGIAAVFMPWLVFTAVLFGQVEIGLSGFQVVLEVIQGLGREVGSGGEATFLPTDPSAALFAIALWVVTGGVLVFVIGSALSTFRLAGGYVMIGAAVTSAVAVSLMAVGAEEAFGTASVLLGVGYGLLFAFLASGVVLAGRFVGSSA